MKIKGKYATAKVFAKTIDDKAIEQIKLLCNQEFAKGSKIRIMPDVHAGKGCTIGFTANIGNKVIPNIVGVDIGCGMLCVNLGKVDIDFEKFDNIVKNCIPCGFDVHKNKIKDFNEIEKMNCYSKLNDKERIVCSLGTLGGGNHFIELDKDDNNCVYLVIHTGSRNLGKQVAEYYQTMAYETLHNNAEELKVKQENLIEEYKKQGKQSQIELAIKELKEQFAYKEIKIPKELCYLTGLQRQLYLEDMAICQKYATLNRELIADIILKKYFNKHLYEYMYFETIHNYIDLKNNIIRKGAISSQKGELILIPINMRDGSLICEGKGNEDWNCSAPHGAGRVLSRIQAIETLSLDEYEKSMNGIFSSCINNFTIDEAPMVYKNIDEIVGAITPTAEIKKIIKPIYNFKAYK